MHDLSPLLAPLLWAAAQVTAVTLAAAALHAAARRAGPRAAGRVALTGLCAAAGLSLTALSPWPRWEAGNAAPVAARPAADRPEASAPAAPRADGARADGARADGAGTDAGPAGVSLAAARGFLAGLLDPATAPVPPDAPSPVTPRPGRASALRGGAVLAGALLLAGVGRFAVGWLLVARLRRRSGEVCDAEVLTEFAALRAAAGVAGPVALLETAALTTAAAVGWRRPAVLLPAGWRAWDPADRRAVLAHELAHVAAGDAAANLLAQSALLAQFYHPLSHWLCGRVRVAQEVAADARAAALVGGRASYLKSLAAVALTADPGPRTRRRQPRAAAWPARAFLPSRRTLHERVEMLRRIPVPPSRLARSAGPLAAAGVLAVAALASGFRAAPAAQPPAVRPAPVAPRSPAKPQAEPAPGGAVEAVPDLLAYVPADAEVIVVIEVRTLLEAPALAPAVAYLRSESDVAQEGLRENFGLTIDEIERVAQYGPRNGRPTFVIRTVGEAPAPPADDRDANGPGLVVKADARTLLFSPGGATSGDRPAASAATLPLLAEVRGAGDDRAAMAAFFNVAAVRADAVAAIDAQPGPDAAWFRTLVRPLLANTDRAAAAVRLDGGDLKGTALADSPTAEGAATVAATVEAARTLGLNALAANPAMNPGDDPVAAAGLGMMFTLARTTLEGLTVSAEGTRVTAAVEADGAAAGMLTAFVLPALQQAAAAARRAQSQNNLQQISLALHNYHSTYKRFPPAVVVENGVKRSWRVELLPYLDAPDLYQAYRKDEPWDSAANLKVLERMPEVFRHSADDRGEPFTSYFAVLATNAEGTFGRYGGPTAWQAEGAPGEGAGVRDMRDGTANTILAVEAKHAVPWTKPEDLTYDATLPAERPDWREPLGLGGFSKEIFQVLFGDGSVRTIHESVDSGLLRSLFTRRGGEIVDLIDDAPRPREAAEPVEVSEEVREEVGKNPDRR